MELREAFAIKPGDIVAIVGGGGKTTLMYRLAREVAAGGGRAVAAGTTLFTPPPHAWALPLVVDADAEHLLAALAPRLVGGAAIIAATGHGDKGRYLPVTPETPARIVAATPDACAFVEADGSRGRAFKAPGEHEPVIPRGATLVIAVAGMSVLGAPLDGEHVHRPEHVTAIAGATEGMPVTREMIATVLAHPLGGRKGVAATMRFAVMINQVSPPLLDDARRIAALLQVGGVARVVLAQAREDPPVVDVIR